LPSVRSRQQAIIQRKRREYKEYIPRLFEVDDSERTEDELAALHQV
jgi:RAB GTPase activating protein 1